MALTLRNTKGSPLTHTELDANFSGLADGSLITPSTQALKIAVAQALGIPFVLAKSAAAVSCPADTSEDTLATITVPAGAMGANGFIRITCRWTTTNNGNNKTYRVRFSGASGTQYMVRQTNSEAFTQTIVNIANRNSASSQEGGWINFHGSGTVNFSNSSVTSSVDTSAATTIIISGQKASSGDTMTLEGYLAELFYGA